MIEGKVHFDSQTKQWFRRHPDAQTTVCQCTRCFLFFKPVLGHKCKKGGEGNDRAETYLI